MSRLQPQHKQTYAIRAPLATHWRSATCAEVECEMYVDGWRLNASVVTDADKKFIRESGRHWTLLDVGNGDQWLVFEPGTPCLLQWGPGQPFTERHHKVQVRPEIYLLTPGDWRMWCGRGYKFDRPDQWVDDFGTHQDRLRELEKRG